MAEAADVKAKVIFTENQRKGAYMQSKRIQRSTKNTSTKFLLLTTTVIPLSVA